MKTMQSSEVCTVPPMLPQHLHTCARATCKFSRYSEAPKTPFRRNPRRVSGAVYPPRRASNGGSKVDLKLGLCLVRSYQHTQTRLGQRFNKARPPAVVSDLSVQKSAQAFYPVQACEGYAIK